MSPLCSQSMSFALIHKVLQILKKTQGFSKSLRGFQKGSEIFKKARGMFVGDPEWVITTSSCGMRSAREILADDGYFKFKSSMPITYNFPISEVMCLKSKSWLMGL